MKFLLFWSYILFVIHAKAQVDTIFVGQQFPGAHKLKSGKSQFVVYGMQNGVRQFWNFTSREIRPLADMQWEIVMRIESIKGVQDHIATVDAGTLAPRRMVRKNSEGIEDYIFEGSVIQANDKVVDNLKVGFRETWKYPFFNFETDFEILQSIRWELNKHVVLPLYHPGGKSKPEFRHYKVVGEEALQLPDGRELVCWKVFFEDQSPTTFWIEKKGNQVIKQHSKIGSNFEAFKIRLYTTDTP